MKKREIIFWGGTMQAVTLRELLPEDIELVAVFDNNRELPSPFPDVPIFYGEEGFEAWLSARPQRETLYFAVAIGSALGYDRCQIGTFLQQHGLLPYSIIADSAIISPTARIGAGVQILPGVVIDARVEIGDYALLNLSVTVAHACKIARGVHLAPSVTMAGMSVIEDYVTLYTGVHVSPRVRVGARSVVGIGSTVLRDIPAGVLAYGMPAVAQKKLF